ncbi:MAG: ABC-F family ATP-binding cassette domain-containing protein [Oscillospiraceae bacterium]|nr:ABC-F family ATP-binding cassette domain-containing protein [Oscillospiraceae bacterium]
MVLLTGDKLCKAYTQRKLLDETAFSIESGDKIGIVGVNGTGKTTFLRILAGEEPLDNGSLMKAGGLRIGYLPQNPDFGQDNTILQQVLLGVSGEAKEYECKSILNKLELTNHDIKISTLSGGQQKRVALAAALVRDVDLLILDEPTNHLDSDMVTWLESYLAAYKGAVLMVTHDRYFLDRVTNRILELCNGKLYSYSCNYTKFLQQKAQREEMAAANERKRQSLVRREVEWILQGPCARGTKSQYRIDRLKQLQSEKVDLTKQSVELSSMSSRLGRKIIELAHIYKGFDGKPLIEDFSYLLLRSDRIGIIGRNGIGKSTLLKLIMGQLQPDSGTVDIGETVKIGYFAQQCEDMNPAQRPIDYVKEESNAIETPDGILTASQLLEKFLFDGDLQYTTISRLSGGERRRLFLLKILMGAPNVLILDEPTNDLDIETLTILEDYLSTFAGAVIMVSHDRYFLDKIANRIFSFENGTIQSYMGGYTDWLIQQEAKTPAPAAKAESSKQTAARTGGEKTKFSFKEQREFDTIDADISALEAAIETVDIQMTKAASNFAQLQQLTAEKETLTAQLSEKMDRWVYLNDLNESFNK